MKSSARKIERMHFLYGKANDKCRNCSHLLSFKPTDRRFYKCWPYGLSRSEASDWRLSWDACGLINQILDPNNFTPVIERIKHESRAKDRNPCEGQLVIDLEDV